MFEAFQQHGTVCLRDVVEIQTPRAVSGLDADLAGLRCRARLGDTLAQFATMGTIFGFAMTRTVSMLTILYCRSRDLFQRRLQEDALEAAPFQRGSLGGKNVPMS